MINNLVATIINEYNGMIQPLIISSKKTNGTGLCNPSLFVEDDKIHLIMRHVEYTLYHSEGDKIDYRPVNVSPKHRAAFEPKERVY